VEKVIFAALERDESGSCDAAGLIEAAAERLGAERYPDVSVQVEDREANDRWRGDRPPPQCRAVATLAVWTECADDVGDVEKLISEVSPRYAGFVVTEAVPRWRAPRSASSAEPQPGVTVTSLLTRAPSLTGDQFLQHWYDVHMPMSLRIHPQWTYVRNVVSRVLTLGAPTVDAICEEGFPEVDDVLEPSRFYGADSPSTPWKQGRVEIGEDVPKFLDPAQTMTSIMREYRLRDFRS
jgi:hypothetical protein